MYKNKYTIVAAVIALMFWFFDALVHYFVYGEARFELIPSDFNELWMRAVIVILLLIIGIYADVTTRNLIIREKELEAYRIYTSMVHASRHILNNLLNQMQIIKIEALKSKDFDRDIIKYYDDMFDEAQDLIHKLSEIKNITDEDIRASVAPVDKKISENGENSE